MSAPGEIRADSQADSQPLLDSQSTTSHMVTVPHPCQNGERIRGSHGHARTIGTSSDQDRRRSHAATGTISSNHSPDRPASARVTKRVTIAAPSDGHQRTPMDGDSQVRDASTLTVHIASWLGTKRPPALPTAGDCSTKAARCARRGVGASARPLPWQARPSARRPDTAAHCSTRAHPARTRSAALPGPSSAGRAARCSRAGYPSGGIVGRPALAGFRPLPSPRPDSQASIAAGGPVTSTGGLVPTCSMP